MKTSKARPKQARYTVRDFQRDFPTDDACLEWLLGHLYPDGIVCKVCRRLTKHHRVRSRRSYSCDNCGHHVHPTAGTILHKSPTALRTWFHAIFLMSTTRTRVSAKWLERQTGVTYKTAWRMFKQIRKMLDEGAPVLRGTVEVDETFIGGRRRGQPRDFTQQRPRHGHRPDPKTGKTIVMGFAERGGRIYATVVPDVKRRTLAPMVERHVMTGSNIFTDELRSYHDLPQRGYNHRAVSHRRGVYVVADVHTNTVEGFWNLLKRGIDGAHRRVSVKYLQEYVNEFTFRFNHRLDARPMFQSMLARISQAPPVA